MHTDKQIHTSPPELKTITNHTTLQEVKDTFSWPCPLLQHTNLSPGEYTGGNATAIGHIAERNGENIETQLWGVQKILHKIHLLC